MYNCAKIIHIIIEKKLTSVLNLTETTQKSYKFKWQKKNLYRYIYIYAYIYNPSETDNVKNGLFWFGNENSVIDWKAQCCMVLCWENISHLLAFEPGQLHRSYLNQHL